jgi:hypothetical protein
MQIPTGSRLTSPTCTCEHRRVHVFLRREDASERALWDAIREDDPGEEDCVDEEP